METRPVPEQVEALALDYDGTLATEGKVGADVVAGLRRWRASGRRLLLVTGRERESLEATFGHLELFDRVVTGLRDAYGLDHGNGADWLFVGAGRHARHPGHRRRPVAR